MLLVGTENTQSQPALPSDPAMQHAGQLSSPTQGNPTNSALNRLTPASGTTTSSGKPNAETTGNQGSTAESTKSDQNGVKNVQNNGATGIFTLFYY